MLFVYLGLENTASMLSQRRFNILLALGGTLQCGFRLLGMTVAQRVSGRLAMTVGPIPASSCNTSLN